MCIRSLPGGTPKGTPQGVGKLCRLRKQSGQRPRPAEYLRACHPKTAGPLSINDADDPYRSGSRSTVTASVAVMGLSASELLSEAWNSLSPARMAFT